MLTIGYTSCPGCPNDPHEMGNETTADVDARHRWPHQAIAVDDPYVRRFRWLTRELGIAIGLTFPEQRPGAARNTMILIDRRDAIILTYVKVHTRDFSMEAACTPCDSLPGAELVTANGAVDIGIMIYFDREFPESARLLMLGGAEIILPPNACPLPEARVGQLRSPDFEKLVGAAMAKYPAPKKHGRSVAFDGMEFDASDDQRDPRVIQAGSEEDLVPAAFDLAPPRDYREREIWGTAFCSPHQYTALIAEKVEGPFVRTRASGQPWVPRERWATDDAVD